MRTITRQQYLAGLGLFLLASKRNMECITFADECAELLGVDRDGHLGDAVWCMESQTEKDFDRMLAKEKIKVEEANNG